MKKIALFAFALFFISFCYAQTKELTGLKASLNKVTDSFKYVNALNRIAILMYHKNADSTFILASQAKRIASRLHYEKGLADALNNQGIFFIVKGNLNLALRYYNQSYNLYHKLGDSANCVQLIMNMALVYAADGRKIRAIEKFDKAMLMGRNLKNDSIVSLVISNYLLSYPKRFDIATKKKYVNQANQIAIKYNDKVTQLAIIQVVADELISEGKRQQGLSLLRHAIDTGVHQKLYYLSMDLLVDMGDKLSVKDSSTAVFYYKKGLSIANRNGILLYEDIIANRLYEFYTGRNDRLTAAIYSSQLIKIYKKKESIASETSIDYLDYILKEERLNTLTERSESQVTLLILTTVACLLVIMILVIVRQNLVRTRKMNKIVISKNNQMEETLAALEQSQADNNNMLKIVAHDLRSPIAGINTIVGIMIEDGTQTEANKEMLKLIKDSSQNSLELVGNLMQMQFETQNLVKETVNLNELLRHCVSILEGNALAKHQQISIEAKHEVLIKANRGKLWRVMSNLITNAIKFSEERALIEIRLEKVADYARIEVIDQGIGIPDEIKNMIFEMFTDARRKGTANEESFGIGLSITKQIVLAHKGRLWFMPNKGKGTTFFVELPAS